MAYPIYLILNVWMSRLPIWEKFHLSLHVAPHVVPIPVAVPSSIYSTLVPSGVVPSTHVIPSLFPPLSIFLFAFVHSSYHAIASLPLMPKFLYAQVGLLGKCSFFPPPCCRQSSSFPCHALVCLLLLLLQLVLSRMLHHVVSLTIPQQGRMIHWVWRSYDNISMGHPPPNEMPRGSK